MLLTLVAQEAIQSFKTCTTLTLNHLSVTWRTSLQYLPVKEYSTPDTDSLPKLVHKTAHLHSPLNLTKPQLYQKRKQLTNRKKKNPMTDPPPSHLARISGASNPWLSPWTYKQPASSSEPHIRPATASARTKSFYLTMTPQVYLLIPSSTTTNPQAFARTTHLRSNETRLNPRDVRLRTPSSGRRDVTGKEKLRWRRNMRKSLW